MSVQTPYHAILSMRMKRRSAGRKSPAPSTPSSQTRLVRLLAGLSCTAVLLLGEATSASATPTTTAMQQQMAVPPVFGSQIPLPSTHWPTPGTELTEGREFLRGRVAAAHVGTRETNYSTITFMAVDRLFDGLGLATKG